MFFSTYFLASDMTSMLRALVVGTEFHKVSRQFRDRKWAEAV